MSAELRDSIHRLLNQLTIMRRRKTIDWRDGDELTRLHREVEGRALLACFDPPPPMVEVKLHIRPPCYLEFADQHAVETWEQRIRSLLDKVQALPSEPLPAPPSEPPPAPPRPLPANDATKGRPGRRGYPLKALDYARKLRVKNPTLKAHLLRRECLKQFSEEDLPPDGESFRRWLNRKRANRAN